MLIQFLNEYGNEIDEQKANFVENFSKRFVENGLIRKEEWYTDGVMTQLTYYANTGENVTNIISSFSNLSLLHDRQIINGYCVYDVTNYNNGVITSRYKEVQNQDYDIIYFHRININTGEIENINKIHYLNGETIYQFLYNANGTIRSIDRVEDRDDYGGVYDEITILKVPDFTWIGLDYFRAATPIVPL